MGFILNIQTEAEVNAWKARAKELNERAKKSVDEAMELLKEMPNIATGKFFNEVLEIANEVCTGMQKILEGMQQLFDVVVRIVSKAKEIVGELIDAAIGTKRKIGAGAG